MQFLMEMDFNFERLLEDRKNNILNYTILDIDLTKTQHVDRHAYILESIREKTGDVRTIDIDLVNLCKALYKHHDNAYWVAFLKNWLPTVTNVVILYTTAEMMPHLFPTPQKYNVHICAILMFICLPEHREVYGRMLGSNCFCGGKLMTYFRDKYSQSPVYKWTTFHCYEHLVTYYKKFGYIETPYYMRETLFGEKYPFMYQPTSESVTETYNFERMHPSFHIHEKRWFVVSVILFFCYYFMYILWI